MRKRATWLTGIIISALIFTGNALAAPAFSVSNVSGYWDKNGTPTNFTDDKITVEFDAYPSGWTLKSTTVWTSTGSGWNCLYDSSRGDSLLQNPYGNHWVMSADKVVGGSVGDLGNVVESAGFYIGYWDGISSNFFAITADGHLYDQQGIPLSPTWPFTSSSPCTITVPDDYSTIQGAIDVASDGCEIIVKDGTYVETINFLGKAIDVRSVNGAAATIIDGNGSGSRVVVFNSGEGATSILDGFTIKNGVAGGIFCNQSSPIITNCTITDNTGTNSAGIYLNKSPSPMITNCIIQNNISTYGGAITCDLSSPTIAGCTIKDNSANWYGSGIFTGAFSVPTIINCTISGNASNFAGGGIYCSSSLTIVNCTISGNTANLGGGGISCGASSPMVKNSILWGNAVGGNPSEIYLYDSGSIDITYSDIQGGWTGEGNINVDPQFAGSEDYHLTLDSPCIDTGTGMGAPADDIDGDTRPRDGNGNGTPEFDMGADEYVTTLAVDIILNQSSFIPGQTLQARAHITNDATPDTVNAKVFVTLPNGSKMVLRTINNCHIPANANINVPVYSYTFKGNEPAGTYQFTGQLLDTATGAVLSEDTESFVFAK